MSSHVMAPSAIITFLADYNILHTTVEELLSPTVDFVCKLYHALLCHLDPSGDDPAGVRFDGLSLIENPEVHTTSVHIANIYSMMKKLIPAVCGLEFTMRDLIYPKRGRTVKLVSAVLNFFSYRNSKVDIFASVLCRFDSQHEEYLELERKKDELSKELADIEAVQCLEQHVVEDLDIEVKGLREFVQSLNKQQMSLRTLCQKLKEEANELDLKISNVEFRRLESVQVRNMLRGKIVQSPEKLQRNLDERKLIRSEVQKAEKLAMQHVQDTSSEIEMYSKAAKTLAKYAAKLKASQEQVSSLKNVDKEIKMSRMKLDDVELHDMPVEVKAVELEERVQQMVALEKVAERERDLKCIEAEKEISNMRVEMEAKLKELDPRKQDVEAIIAEADDIDLQISAVRTAGEDKQEKIFNMFEAIISEVHGYSRSIEAILSQFGEDGN